jgi:CspA family cold shock protein
MPDTGIQEGKIKWYNFNKGYGFIELADGAGDVFVHAKELMRSGVNGTLNPGQSVKFVPGKGPKGVYATNISIVEARK